MRRQVTTASVRHVIICDLCAKDCTGFSDTCWLCRRDVCFQCHTLMFCGKHDDVLDMPMKVCARCLEGHSETVAEIQSALDVANKRIRQTLDGWREASVRRKEIDQP
jgi:hypothetical protein